MTRKEKTIAGLVLVVNLSVGAWLARGAELGGLVTGVASIDGAQAAGEPRTGGDPGPRLAAVRDTARDTSPQPTD
jgi:hypothetical protein